MTTMTCSKLIFLALVCAYFLPQTSCHFFSMKFFRHLIPSKRVSNITIGKTEAVSVTGCNLECLNKKPCISTLFTISKNKCVLLKSFFDEIKEFVETAENNNAVKVIESRSQAPFSLLKRRRNETCLNDDTVGAVCKLVQGFNCMDLKKTKNDLTSGYYHVWMNSTKREKIRVFCDMETDGGGWTEILRVKSNTSSFREFLTTPFKRWVNLNGFAGQGNYMIEPSALSKSSLVGDGSQFRFECKLPSLGKHIHLVTSKDQHGKAVVNWLTGKSDTRPRACQSFKPLQSDNSYLASHCSDWGASEGKWGKRSSPGQEDRFIYSPMYVSGTVHWHLFWQNVFECDNNQGYRIAKEDYWQIYVR